MKSFIIYHISTGSIVKWGHCLDGDLELQKQSEGEKLLVVKKLRASYFNYKVVNNKIIKKPPTEKPIPIPYEQQQAYVTNEQWQSILDRLDQLEAG